MNEIDPRTALRIPPHRRPYSFVPSGWRTILRTAEESIASVVPDFTLSQVKEKLGGLTIHIGELPAATLAQERTVYSIISDARKESLRTCEVCGSDGHPRQAFNWIKTLCDKHASSFEDGKYPRTFRLD